jgi:hypothetical protein
MGESKGQMSTPEAGVKLGPVKDLSDVDEGRQEEYADFAKERPQGAQTGTSSSGESSDVGAENGAHAPTGEQEGVASPEEMALLDAVSEEAEELGQNDTICQNCGQDPEADTPLPPMEDRQHFIRCLLAGDRYTRTYKMFNGEVIVKLKDVSPLATERIYVQLGLDARSGRIITADDEMAMLERYRLFAALSELSVGGNKVELPEVKALDDGGTLYVDQPEDWHNTVTSSLMMNGSTVVFRALMQLGREWDQHLDVLKARANDADFWIADGSDSPSEPTPEAPSPTEA